MKKGLDFISQMGYIIPEGGMVVRDNVTRMPIYNEPYFTPYYIICINHQGSAELEYDGRSVQFNQHDVAIVYPRHIIVNQSATSDYRATLIIVSPSLLSKVHAINSNIDPFLNQAIPQFTLTEKQYTDMALIVNALKTVLDIAKEAPREIFHTGLLYLIMYIVNTFRKNNIGPSDNNGGTVTSRLYEALTEHYAEHHDVNYYASLCCLSPKYFSTIVKQETGHAASHWIQQYIVTMAKVLFQTEPTLTIEEVSDRLGFVELSAFSRFFRHQTGLSPSAYRQMLSEDLQ